MEIITIRHSAGHVTDHSAGHSDAAAGFDDSPDREYMEMCAQVDHNPPGTWKNYDMESPAGVKKVIEMEYKELMSAATEHDTMENIFHLSVALLRLWRLHNAKHRGGYQSKPD